MILENLSLLISLKTKMETKEKIGFLMLFIILFVIIYTIIVIYRSIKRKKELLKYVRKVMGENDYKRVKKKYIYIGLPECLIPYVWGLPDNIIKNVGNDIYKHYLFGEHKNRLGNTKYTYKITCKNYFIESYGDI